MKATCCRERKKPRPTLPRDTPNTVVILQHQGKAAHGGIPSAAAVGSWLLLGYMGHRSGGKIFTYITLHCLKTEMLRKLPGIPEKLRLRRNDKEKQKKSLSQTPELAHTTSEHLNMFFSKVEQSVS